MKTNFTTFRPVLFTLGCAFSLMSATAQDSLTVLAKEEKTNSIGLKYDVIAFEKGFNEPWHLLSLEYTKGSKKMPLIARLNYANRFRKSGLQLEAEAYPKISKKIYSYIGVGYSKDSLLFPKFRAGYSIYISLPATFEAEGGFRLLYFNKPTWIYTAALGKYYKSYWFNLGAFLTPASNSVLQSYFLRTRYYLNDKDYIMLTLGTGISPDDRSNNIQINNKARLNSKRAEITFRNTIKKKNVILINAGWMNQEYEDKKYNHQYNVGIGLQRNL